VLPLGDGRTANFLCIGHPQLQSRVVGIQAHARSDLKSNEVALVVVYIVERPPLVEIRSVDYTELYQCVEVGMCISTKIMLAPIQDVSTYDESNTVVCSDIVGTGLLQPGLMMLSGSVASPVRRHSEVMLEDTSTMLEQTPIDWYVLNV